MEEGQGVEEGLTMEESLRIEVGLGTEVGLEKEEGLGVEEGLGRGDSGQKEYYMEVIELVFGGRIEVIAGDPG